jgi:hypothetical protein
MRFGSVLNFVYLARSMRFQILKRRSARQTLWRTGCGFWLGIRSFAEHSGRALKQLISQLLDLVRMDIEILRQLDQRLLALDRSYRRFRLGYRAV